MPCLVCDCPITETFYLTDTPSYKSTPTLLIIIINERLVPYTMINGCGVKKLRLTDSNVLALKVSKILAKCVNHENPLKILKMVKKL